MLYPLAFESKEGSEDEPEAVSEAGPDAASEGPYAVSVLSEGPEAVS